MNYEEDKEGSSPLWEEEREMEMEMLSEFDLAAAQRATEWIQKFALLLIFLASHKESEVILFKDDIITGEILQSWSEEEELRAWITIKESPSRINRFKDKERAIEVANWAANASPMFGEQGGLMR